MFTFSTFEYEVHQQRLQELEQEARREALVREAGRANRLPGVSRITRSARALAGILYSARIAIQKLPQIWSTPEPNPCAEA